MFRISTFLIFSFVFLSNATGTILYEGVDETDDHSPPLPTYDLLKTQVQQNETSLRATLSLDEADPDMGARSINIHLQGKQESLSYACRLGGGIGGQTGNQCQVRFHATTTNSTEGLTGENDVTAMAVVSYEANAVNIQHPRTIGGTPLDLAVANVVISMQPEIAVHANNATLAAAYGPIIDQFSAATNFAIGNASIIEQVQPFQKDEPAVAEEKESPAFFVAPAIFLASAWARNRP